MTHHKTEPIISKAHTQSQQLPDSLTFIIQQLENQHNFKPSQVRRILLNAQVKVEDLKPWSDFNHPPEDSYGRKLVYETEHFEIMVMSWQPGDFSTIHDHGYTQWGAVQVFGAAEHATFRLDENEGIISTLSRQIMKPGDVIGVSHHLLHQMGNPTSDNFFLTLHVYGTAAGPNITGNARVFDLENGTIQRINGGVFFGLAKEEIECIETGVEGDFPTRLRHMVELIRRLRKMEQQKRNNSGKELSVMVKDLMSADHRLPFIAALRANSAAKGGHQTNSVFWRILNWELRKVAKLQNDLFNKQSTTDNFQEYAALYDALICQPCIDGFMAGYLEFFQHHYQIDFGKKNILSLGTGTGLVEKFMIEKLGVDYNKLFGLDISEAMISVANRRIRAEVGDVLTLDPSVRLWDLTFSGLNVFHYLDHTRLEEAIQKTAAVTQSGGYFIGDFITPDHIRWYPNVMFSEDEKIISLRTPQLIEENGAVFQESEITNISFISGQMRVTYSGKHRRFLPPIHRIRVYFERAFGGVVKLFDAKTLKEIPEWADSCSSTRYVVVAQKK